ncbi:MAG: hypothetical protein ACFFA6_02860 [Promethearchaeota archaeon]
MLTNFSLFKKILFFNIGRYNHDNDTFYEWKSNYFHKSSFFEVKLTRNAPERNIFYCITKSDIKLVYYAQNDAVFTIGADPEIQSQLLEAILEYLIDKFFYMYDESLLTTCYGDICDIFNGFSSVLHDIFSNYKNSDLIKTALVTCKGCGRTLTVLIKKSLIENSTKTTTPLVYVHSGHALLLYIDKKYKIRGSELVSVSY